MPVIQGFEHLRLCETDLAAGQPVDCDVNLQRIVEKGRALLEGWSVGVAGEAADEAADLTETE